MCVLLCGGSVEMSPFSVKPPPLVPLCSPCVCCGGWCLVCSVVAAFVVLVLVGVFGFVLVPLALSFVGVFVKACVSPVMHLGRCLDYFVAMGFGVRRVRLQTAALPNTVTSNAPQADARICMYKVPMALPAHLWGVSPTNPFNYAAHTVNAKSRHYTVGMTSGPVIATLLFPTLDAVAVPSFESRAPPALRGKTVARCQAALCGCG